MNKLAFAFSFLLLANSPMNALAKSGDDGWSSSGGGEFIINENNPWFIGNEKVKWCLNHGGDDKFSLNLNDSKMEVERGLNVLISQLKEVNTHSSVIPRSNFGNFNGETTRKTYDQDFPETENTKITDEYEFTGNCEEADLEIILGNYEDPKIKTLIEMHGKLKFQYLAGVAIRTSYDTEKRRGKGFIYIASDKGELQYRGARNTMFPNKTIWDTAAKYRTNAPVPHRFSGGKQMPFSTELILHDDFPYLFMKDQVYGTLAPVIAHEFGHTLGLKHNNFSNIMDVDYPAKVVETGLVFKGNFLRASAIFNQALLQTDINLTLGYEWIRSGRPKHYDDYKEKSKDIFDFIYGIRKRDADNSDEAFVLAFNIGKIDARDDNARWDQSGDKKLTILEVAKNSLKYEKVNEYTFALTYPCQETSLIDAIYIREIIPTREVEGLVFDSQKQQWVYQKASSVDQNSISTFDILRFEDTVFCGKIYLNKQKSRHINFRLFHNYYNKNSELQLIDVKTGANSFIWFNQSDILGKDVDFKNLVPSPAFFKNFNSSY